MSAECRKCSRDLDGDFKCAACDCAQALTSLRAERDYATTCTVNAEARLHVTLEELEQYKYDAEIADSRYSFANKECQELSKELDDLVLDHSALKSKLAEKDTELDQARTILSGRTYFHSDEGVEALLKDATAALEKVTKFAKELCADVNVSQHQPSIENAEETLRKLKEGVR